MRLPRFYAIIQKDLGPATAELAERMTLFNPDKAWQKVSESTSYKVIAPTRKARAGAPVIFADRSLPVIP